MRETPAAAVNHICSHTDLWLTFHASTNGESMWVAAAHFIATTSFCTNKWNTEEHPDHTSHSTQPSSSARLQLTQSLLICQTNILTNIFTAKFICEWNNNFSADMNNDDLLSEFYFVLSTGFKTYRLEGNVYSKFQVNVEEMTLLPSSGLSYLLPEPAQTPEHSGLTLSSLRNYSLQVACMFFLNTCWKFN